ncbi:MAG: thioredoxin domain-containing protein [Myxococcota bacterium]|jgi:2-hydroxychromene-2-carboxylate isomerase|nr:thioredoxin domain-containing protein [Myxococcota bacterium]
MPRIKLVFLALVAMSVASLTSCEKKPTSAGPEGSTEKVTMQLYVMSKCPYGVQAVDAILPAVQKLGSAVELKLEFIGDGDASNLQSMHGPAEVEGNIIQICAAQQDPTKFYAMLKCMNENWQAIPEGWEACADKAGLDKAKLTACKTGEEGKKLLAESYARAKASGVQGSPTIRIAGSDYQGGRRGDDFLRGMCDKLKTKPEICTNIPPPPEVQVIVLTDARCKECAVDGLIAKLGTVFPGLKPKTLDWADPQAKKIYEEAQLKALPAALFDASIEKDKEGNEQMGRWLEPAGPYKSLRLGGKFDPKAEICDNKVDDTGDGKMDCDDETCKQALACRQEKKAQLDVFIMSQCPFGVQAVNNMKDVLGAFGKDMKFGVHFIATETPEGIQSMHGPAEVEEDLRQICAIQTHPKNNKWLDYFWCRNENIQSPEWQACTGEKTGIDKAKIEKCVTGEQGKKLLGADAAMAMALDIGASPTWMVNNRRVFNGVDPKEIQTQFCQDNPTLAGCKVEIKSTQPQNVPAEGGCGG